MGTNNSDDAAAPKDDSPSESRRSESQRSDSYNGPPRNKPPPAKDDDVIPVVATSDALAPRRMALPRPRGRAPLPAKTRPTPPLKPKPAAAGSASDAVRLDTPDVVAPVTSPARGADASDGESGSIEPPPSSGQLRDLVEQMTRDEAAREHVDDATREAPEPPPSSRRNLAAKRTRTPDAVAEPSDARVRAPRVDVQPPPAEKPGIHRGLVAAIAFALGIAATLAAQSAMRDGTTSAARESDERVASGDDATPSTPTASRAGGESEPANSAEAPVAVAERSAVEPNAADDRVPHGGSIPVTDATSATIATTSVTASATSARAAASAAPSAAVSAAPAALAEFDKAAAAAAVAGAAGAAAGCADGVHSGRAPMAITFAPSGRVTVAVIAGYSPLAGTSVGSCVANAMRSARVPPFSGGPMTVRKTVSVP